MISRIEKRDKENEKSQEKIANSHAIAQSTIGMNDQQNHVDSNITKQKLADYEEAFRKLYVKEN